MLNWIKFRFNVGNNSATITLFMNVLKFWAIKLNICRIMEKRQRILTNWDTRGTEWGEQTYLASAVWGSIMLAPPPAGNSNAD